MFIGRQREFNWTYVELCEISSTELRFWFKRKERRYAEIVNGAIDNETFRNKLPWGTKATHLNL